MIAKTWVIVYLVCFILQTAVGQVGQSCTIKHTGTPGICQITTNCPSAKRQAALSILPTNCGYINGTIPIVCCDDEIQANENSFLNLPDINNPEGIVYPDDNAKPAETSSFLSLAEQKCHDYSKTTVEQVQILALIAGGEPYTFETSKCDKNGIPLIIGGEPAELGEFPFMAALGYPSEENNELKWSCGGTLISENFVLTAAHCIKSRIGKPEKVRLGALNLKNREDSGPVDYDIEKYIVHPNYRIDQNYNDIALLKLKGTIKFSSIIRPACLWTAEKVPELTVATGWGTTDKGEPSDKLLKVSLRVHENSICDMKYHRHKKIPNGIVDQMICAGDLEGSKDTCTGDSGGPLLVTKSDNQCVFYVVGVTSFGKIACALKDIPAIYTRVSSYIPWIEREVWN